MDLQHTTHPRKNEAARGVQPAATEFARDTAQYPGTVLCEAEIDLDTGEIVEPAAKACPICKQHGGNNNCSYCCDDPEAWDIEPAAQQEGAPAAEQALNWYRQWAVNDALRERRNQDHKWGQQNHEMQTWMLILHEETGELSEALLHESFGGPKRNNVFNEAVQVAAVALQIVEYLRRKIGPHPTDAASPSPAQEKPVAASVERVLCEVLDIATGYGEHPPSLWRIEEYCRAALASTPSENLRPSAKSADNERGSR